jgi:predicted phosphodiesterase
MKTRLAVISDIHSNSDALLAVMQTIKNDSIDMIICLGDILTYGCQPLEVIDILNKYNEENSIIFIKGNHDQFYFDLQNGRNSVDYKLPSFVEDSINWTLEKIQPLILENEFLWRENFNVGNVFFSHANPFKYGDWSYLEKKKDLSRAFKYLNNNSFSGVFGHSHRQLFAAKHNDHIFEIDNYSSNLHQVDQLIINTGSVGQPRGKGLGYLVLEMQDNRLDMANFQKIQINFANSINLINEANFSKDTKSKLTSYLKT